MDGGVVAFGVDVTTILVGDGVGDAVFDNVGVGTGVFVGTTIEVFVGTGFAIKNPKFIMLSGPCNCGRCE